MIQRPGAAWGLFAGLLAAGACGLTTLALPPYAHWDWQPDLAWREPWRWWSAAWVQWSPMHLRMNLAGCALLIWLGARAGLRWQAAVAWALAWPLTQLGLSLQPALAHYGGLSGVLHAGIVILACELLGNAGEMPARPRWIGGLIGIGLVLKLWTEQAWVATVQQPAGWDFALAPGAHVSGAVAGLLVAGGLRWCSGPPRC